MTTHVLIADDEVNLRTVLGATLRRAGYEVTLVGDARNAMQAVKGADPDDAVHVVVTDLRMPGDSGLDLLRSLRSHQPELPVILITAHGTVDVAVQALKDGAFDFITKPFEQDELLAVVQKAATTHALADAESLPGDDPARLLVGDSPELAAVLEVIERIADSPSTVLISGESGTGKELVASAIHHRSSRRDAPLIKINCAAIPHGLIESELFGHDKGAFTGATATKPGRFELADGGSLFLDEVGEIPLEMQVKLLRVLQDGCLEHVGGVKTVRINARLITATHRDLAADVRAGRFREDLFYRLNVVPIALPPLRRRVSDIPHLLRHFVRRFNPRLDRQVQHFSDEAVAILQAYPWPGNIRELENIVERTMLFADGPVIEADDLPPELSARSDALRDLDLPDPDNLEGGSLKQAVRTVTARVERDLIARALEHTGGNVTHAAQRLKISRKGLQLKMRDLGLRSGEGVLSSSTD